NSCQLIRSPCLFFIVPISIMERNKHLTRCNLSHPRGYLYLASSGRNNNIVPIVNTISLCVLGRDLTDRIWTGFLQLRDSASFCASMEVIDITASRESQGIFLAWHFFALSIFARFDDCATPWIHVF